LALAASQAGAGTTESRRPTELEWDSVRAPHRVSVARDAAAVGESGDLLAAALVVAAGGHLGTPLANVSGRVGWRGDVEASNPASPTVITDAAADVGWSFRLTAPAGGSSGRLVGWGIFTASWSAMSVPWKSIGLFVILAFILICLERILK